MGQMKKFLVELTNPSTRFLSLLTLEYLSSYSGLIFDFLVVSCTFSDAVNAGYRE